MRIRSNKNHSSRIKLPLLVGLVVVFLIAAVGCGGSADLEQPADLEPVKESPMATGGTSGTGITKTCLLYTSDAADE